MTRTPVSPRPPHRPSFLNGQRPTERGVEERERETFNQALNQLVMEGYHMEVYLLRERRRKLRRQLYRSLVGWTVLAFTLTVAYQMIAHALGLGTFHFPYVW